MVKVHDNHTDFFVLDKNVSQIVCLYFHNINKYILKIITTIKIANNFVFKQNKIPETKTKK